MLTGVSLFAGVGGFDLAMERNGVKVVANVEIDKHCQSLLERKFPDAKQFNDVTTVKGKDLIDVGFNPSRGIITGGFPCQDLSVAGKRAGLAGERSGLFWEIARIVEETQTEWFILENVPGLLSSNEGKDFGVVLGTMADLGYSVAWRTLDAQHFGVPQRRRRVFIVGRRSSGERGPDEVLFKPQSLRRNTSQVQSQGKDVTTSAARSFGQSSFAGYTEGVTTITATSYKRPEDNVVVYEPKSAFEENWAESEVKNGLRANASKSSHVFVTSSSFGGYTEGVGTLRANGGDLGGGSENLVVHQAAQSAD